MKKLRWISIFRTIQNQIELDSKLYIHYQLLFTINYVNYLRQFIFIKNKFLILLPLTNFDTTRNKFKFYTNIISPEINGVLF